MKNKINLLLLSVLLATQLAGCGSKAAPSGDRSEAASAPAANSNAATKDAGSSDGGSSPGNSPSGSASNPATQPIVLEGTYAISEVQDKGIVTMVSPTETTDYIFGPEDKFVRISRRGGKVDYKDSGNFAIEGNDQLVLRIVMSRGKMQLPPVEKRHTFTLSSTREDLTLTGKDGKKAVLRRRTNP